MNDLEELRGSEIVTVDAALLRMSKAAWRTEPLGHTIHQIRNFMITRDNPTPDTQYRQCVLELWGRWEAYLGARFRLKSLKAEIEIALADIEGLKHRWIFTPWGRRKRAAEIALKEATVEHSVEQVAIIGLDLEHRICRETRVIVDVMKQLPVPTEDRATAEIENWKARTPAQKEKK